VVAAAAAVAACGGSDAPTTPKDPAVIGATGGTVKTADGKTQVVIPPGALTSNVKITIDRAADDPVDLVARGSVFEFGPTGTQFAQPVELRIPFDSAGLAPGTDFSSLYLGRRRNDGTWEPVDDVVVDSANRVVRGKTTHFSTYSVTTYPCNFKRIDYSLTNSVVTTSRLESTDCSDHGNRWEWWLGGGENQAEIEVSSSLPYRVVVGSELHLGPTDTKAPTTGLVTDSLLAGGTTTMRVATNKSPQVAVIAMDSTARGEFRIRYAVLSNHQVSAGNGCDRGVFIERGASIQGTLTANGDCAITIKYSPFPVVNGKQAYADYYWVKAGQGEVALNVGPTAGTTDSTRYRTTLAIFRAGQQPIVVAGAGNNGYRLDTGGTSTTGYYLVEISNGVLFDGEWRTPDTEYSFSVGCIACPAGPGGGP
jgi:hypothetical protein